MGFGFDTVAVLIERDGLRQRVTDLERELAQERAGWRDISTAPKDGSKFWGHVGEDAIAMFWHPGFGEFVSDFRRMTMAPGYTIDGEPFKDHSPTVHKPSGWRPLPAPPAKGGE